MVTGKKEIDMKTVLKVGTTLNIFLCIYGVTSILLFCFGFSPKRPDTTHIVVSVCIVVIWMVILVMSKKIDMLTLASFLMTINIWPFPYLLKLIPPVLFFLLFVGLRGYNYKKMISILLVVVIMISLVVIFLGECLGNHLSDEKYIYYVSEDSKNEIEVYSCYIDGLNAYRYAISYKKGFSIDLGAREFTRFVPYFKYDLQYKDNQDSSFRWIDNDTFEFAGEQYEVNK